MGQKAIEGIPRQQVEPSDFDGWNAGWSPPWAGTVEEWAEENIVLPGGYALPGPFSVAPSKWMIPIFEALQDPAVRQVSLTAGTQQGKSMVADIWVPYLMVNDPGNLLWVQQTDDDAKDHCKMRLRPLLQACNPIAPLMPTGRGDVHTNKIFFGNFSLLVVGANINNLQSKSFRYLVASELWLPQWRKLFGEAMRRLDYFRKLGTDKVFAESQPGTMKDEMHQIMVKSTWEQVHVDSGKGPGPLKWYVEAEDGSKAGVIWDENARDEDGRWNRQRVLETIRYKCPKTGVEIEDSDQTRARWNDSVTYVATNPEADPAHRGFAINRLLDEPLRDLANLWLDAQLAAADGNMEPLKQFTNKKAGEFWEPKVITIAELDGGGYSLEDIDPTKPEPDERDRIMGVDRQQDHHWVEIRSILNSGDTKQLYYGRVETPEQIEHLRDKYNVKPRLTVIDCNYSPGEVYALCARYKWTAAGGENPKTYPRQDRSVNPPRPYKDLVSDIMRVLSGSTYIYKFNFSGDPIKDILAARMQSGRWIHADDASEDYKEQIRQEHKVEKNGKWRWERITKNNHGWDCSVMILAMMMQLRWIRTEAGTVDNEDSQQ